jgi:hypothetical protein
LWTQTIRERLFYQEFHDLLRVEQVFAVPEVPAPQRAPELFQGLWWERWDLTVTFNEMVRHNWLVAYLKSTEITVSVDQTPMEGTADVTGETTVVHNQ